MAEIRWTEEAESWLREIYEYIYADNPPAAEKVVLGIFEKVQTLQEFPFMGHRYRTEEEGEVRLLLYGHYRIAYLLRDSSCLDILGVFHDALEIERYLS